MINFGHFAELLQTHRKVANEAQNRLSTGQIAALCHANQIFDITWLVGISSAHTGGTCLPNNGRRNQRAAGASKMPLRTYPIASLKAKVSNSSVVPSGISTNSAILHFDVTDVFRDLNDHEIINTLSDTVYGFVGCQSFKTVDER